MVTVERWAPRATLAPARKRIPGPVGTPRPLVSGRPPTPSRARLAHSNTLRRRRRLLLRAPSCEVARVSVSARPGKPVPSDKSSPLVRRGPLSAAPPRSPPKVALHRVPRSHTGLTARRLPLCRLPRCAPRGSGVGRGRMRSLLTPLWTGFTLLTPSCFHTVARGSIVLPAIGSHLLQVVAPGRTSDELGHLASRRLGRSSCSTPHWVAAPSVTPVLSDQRLQTHDSSFKERVPRRLGRTLHHIPV